MQGWGRVDPLLSGFSPLLALAWCSLVCRVSYHLVSSLPNFDAICLLFNLYLCGYYPFTVTLLKSISGL